MFRDRIEMPTYQCTGPPLEQLPRRRVHDVINPIEFVGYISDTEESQEMLSRIIHTAFIVTRVQEAPSTRTTRRTRRKMSPVTAILPSASPFAPEMDGCEDS